MPKPTHEELEQKIHELEGQKKTSSQKDVRIRNQADYVLAENEEKYKTLFENMVQGAFYQCSGGELIDCNSAVLEMFGLSRDQFMGKTSVAPGSPPGGIYLTDKDGDCVYANKAWLKMAGMSLYEAKRKGWIKSIHPEDRERIRQGCTIWSRPIESGKMSTLLSIRRGRSHTKIIIH